MHFSCILFIFKTQKMNLEFKVSKCFQERNLFSSPVLAFRKYLATKFSRDFKINLDIISVIRAVVSDSSYQDTYNNRYFKFKTVACLFLYLSRWFYTIMQNFNSASAFMLKEIKVLIQNGKYFCYTFFIPSYL